MGKSLVKKLAEDDAVEVNADGSCPDGYVLSDDKSKCVMVQQATESKEEETKESVGPVEFKIGSKNPQFVFDSPIKIKIEANKFVSFDEGELVEVVENKLGNIQIGINENVIEISDEKLATKFFESVNLKSDVTVEDREVTVAEAIKSNMDVLKVANSILEQHKTLEGLKEGNSMVRIKVGRKIRTLRSTAMKAAAVRPVESKETSFILHKALDIVK